MGPIVHNLCERRNQFPFHSAVKIHKSEPSGCMAPSNWNRGSAVLNSCTQSSSSRSREFWISFIVRSVLLCAYVSTQ